MKTIFRDLSGDKLKRLEYKVELKKNDPIEWNGIRTKIKDLYYDATIDSQIVVLDIDLSPKEIEEEQ